MFSRRVALIVSTAALVFAAAGVRAADTQAPDALIKQVSVDVLDTIKSDKSFKTGGVNKVMALVDAKVMPYVNFQRMTSAAVGRYWRQATPEQQKRLQEEFKVLLVRTYAGALAQVMDQTVQLKPMRGSADDNEVVVKTEVKSKGDSIQLDYRLEKSPDGWKIYDVNVLGIWLVENYRSSFAQEIGQHGIDGLIARLAERNRSGAAGNGATNASANGRS